MSAVTSASVRQDWDAHIHDLDISTHEAGTPGFFADLDVYHFEKLHHLLRLVDFDALAAAPCSMSGVGLAWRSSDSPEAAPALSASTSRSRPPSYRNRISGHQRLSAPLAVAGGETLPFRDDTFDFVYAHGVIQYAADDRRVVSECHRVLRPGGLALFQVYNRVSWLHLLSNVMRVPLEHEDAPVLRRYSIGEFRALLGRFSTVEIIPERFPVKSRLHKGWKGTLFNVGFVGPFMLSRAHGSADLAGTSSRSAGNRAGDMTDLVSIPLVKTHALGNDFLLARADGVGDRTDLPDLARRACDRHRGIGADGLMILESTPDGAETRLFNADGGEAEVSGNGVRKTRRRVARARARAPPWRPGRHRHGRRAEAA